MMDVRYRSTRNSEVTVTCIAGILKGLADDGGLFVPDQIPKLDVSMEELKGNELSGDCLCSYEAVSDRFYRGRAEELYQIVLMMLNLTRRRSHH